MSQMESASTRKPGLVITAELLENNALLNTLALVARSTWEQGVHPTEQFAAGALNKVIIESRVLETAATSENQYVLALRDRVQATMPSPYGVAMELDDDTRFGYILLIGIALGVPFYSQP